MNSQRLVLVLALALGCTPRAGLGGGGGFFDPDASPGDDAATGADTPATGDDTPTGADTPATGDDVPVAPTDVPASPCTGDESCGAGRFCDNGTCRAQVCAPGSATCVGATAIALCDPRGASRAEMPCPGGAGCVDGRCQSPRICTPGAAMCEGSASRRVCTPDGTAYMTVACAAGEQCADGACRAAQVCVPGTVSCGADGQRRTCNEAGSGYTSMACPGAANATSACQDGRCVASCNAGYANCDGEASNGCEVSLPTSAAHCGACGNACSAGQTCVSGTCTGGGGGGSFRVNTLLTSGCTTVDHTTSSGDDRGPMAALNGYLVVSGDNAMVSVSQSTQSVLTVPLRLDWYSSNVRTGQLVVFAAGSQPLPINSGGTATHIAIVDPATAQPVGAPILLSQSVRIVPGAGFFAGWDRVVVWDTSTLWDINLTSGAVRSLGSFAMPTHMACEIGGLWGVAETDGGETDLLYVSSTTTISRVRVSTRAVTTFANYSNLGDMCGISVLPGSNRWYFHVEGLSQFRSSGDEISGWCNATFTNTGSGTACTAPEVACGGTCANLQTSPLHCGTCNTACPTGQSCVSGVCTSATGGYVRTTPSLTWIDACALTGSSRVLMNLDDQFASATLPFPNFLYWGRRVSAVNVATNGYISFDGMATASTSGALPDPTAPNAVVAPWWTDLRTSASGVCIGTTGTTGSRTFIVQWNSANYYSTTAGNLTFQVRLNESNNSIEFLYNNLSAAPSGYPPTVGIENWEGARADSVCAGSTPGTSCAGVVSGARYRFTPN